MCSSPKTPAPIPPAPPAPPAPPPPVLSLNPTGKDVKGGTAQNARGRASLRIDRAVGGLGGGTGSALNIPR